MEMRGKWELEIMVRRIIKSVFRNTDHLLSQKSIIDQNKNIGQIENTHISVNIQNKWGILL